MSQRLRVNSPSKIILIWCVHRVVFAQLADDPLQSMPQTGKKYKQPEPAQQGAGLKMAAHPLLLDTTPAAPQSKKDKYKPMQPKFASIKV